MDYRGCSPWAVEFGTAHPAAKKALAEIYNAEDRTTTPSRPPKRTITKGSGSRAAGVAMAFKLIERSDDQKVNSTPRDTPIHRS